MAARGPSERKRLKWLFERCSFDVLAPSRFTLDLWKAKAGLPTTSARVHPHWRLDKEHVPASRRAAYSEGPVRVGFVGFPSAAKGWQVFVSLMDAFAGDKRYRFIHFGARTAITSAECEFVVTEVTPMDRQATTRMLRDYEIDFLAVLSPWPETFSFVAHEGIAAGTDSPDRTVQCWPAHHL